MDLNAWLTRTRVVVCVGSGGVGKTTTAAAIGLWGALQGRKVMVLTIDPARRLANSLGLSAFGNEAQRLELPEEGPGELWAMMLDTRTTWDDTIRRMSSDDAQHERILANRVYRYLAGTFAGSQEYMATERLYEVTLRGDFDLIVLDTPPVKNALDFLESPGRMVHFLDEKILHWFLAPYEKRSVWGGRPWFGTSAIVWRLLGHIFGRDFLDDLATLFQDFEGMYEGFAERHQAILSLFSRPDTAFVTVCSPTESSIDVARFFQEELAVRSLPRAGVVVNQVHRCEGDRHDARGELGAVAVQVGADLDPVVRSSVLARLGMAHRRLRRLARAEEALVAELRRAASGGGFLQQVPRLEDEVHDLTSLREVGRALFLCPAESLDL